MHPRGGDHPAEQNVSEHYGADNQHRIFETQAEEQADQIARAHHLRNQVKGDDRERADGGRDPHRLLLQAEGNHVGKREAAQIA